MLKNKVEVNMTTNKISVRQYISLKRIANLLNCAIDSSYGSSWYWCEWIKNKTVKPLKLDFMFDDDRVTVYRNIDYPLNVGGSIVLKDIESYTFGTEYILNLVKIKKGLSIMSKDFPRHYADFLNENEDAVTGDVFLQCCIFGKIIYG